MATQTPIPVHTMGQQRVYGIPRMGLFEMDSGGAGGSSPFSSHPPPPPPLRRLGSPDNNQTQPTHLCSTNPDNALMTVAAGGKPAPAWLPCLCPSAVSVHVVQPSHLQPGTTMGTNSQLCMNCPQTDDTSAWICMLHHETFRELCSSDALMFYQPGKPNASEHC